MRAAPSTARWTAPSGAVHFAEPEGFAEPEAFAEPEGFRHRNPT